jgi:hypothetical protein
MPSGESNLSEAIRKALGVFGTDSDREKGKQIRDWVKQHYPALSEKVDSASFGSALSNQRKKVAEGGAGGEETADSTAPLAVTGARQETPRKATPASTLDVAGMVEAVKDLQALADRVGGKENLRRLWELLS